MLSVRYNPFPLIASPTPLHLPHVHLMRVISFPVFNFLISTSPFDPEGISALPALLLKALCQSFFIRMICLARGMSSVDSGDCSLRSFGVSHRRFCTLRASTSQASFLYHSNHEKPYSSFIFLISSIFKYLSSSSFRYSSLFH